MYIRTGAVDVGLVKNPTNGTSSGVVQLSSSPYSNSIYICIAGVVIINVAIHYHLKGAFVIAIVTCSLLSWGIIDDWPGKFDFVGLYLYKIFDFDPHKKTSAPPNLFLKKTTVPRALLFFQGVKTRLERFSGLLFRHHLGVKILYISTLSILIKTFVAFLYSIKNVIIFRRYSILGQVYHSNTCR